MQLNSEVVTSPPRASATVVMLRDTPAGMEVFLLKRHGLSDVMAGAYVFPGGKVDACDADPQLHERLDHPALALHAALHEPDLDTGTAASLYVAAIREAFEESGILFAHQADAALADHAGALLREGLGFDAMLRRLALRLDTESIVPWSRWVTPRVPTVSTKRFDTRFFVAAVPGAQVARHDNHEATDSAWLTPRAALEAYWRADIQIAPPQIMSLAHLSHYARVDQVLAAARRRPPPLVAPEPFELDGQRNVAYPGDSRHSVAARALPGPTRLAYRNGRFEPEGGFEALFERADGLVDAD